MERLRGSPIQRMVVEERRGPGPVLKQPPESGPPLLYPPRLLCPVGGRGTAA